MFHSTPAQRAWLAGCLTVLAVVLLNSPHRGMSIRVGGKMLECGDRDTWGWPAPFRGQFPQVVAAPTARTGSHVLFAWTWSPLRVGELLFDLAFAVCLTAATAALSRRAGRQFSLRALLALVTMAAVLMAVLLRWDGRAAAAALGIALMAAAVWPSVRRVFARIFAPSRRVETPLAVDPVGNAAL